MATGHSYWGRGQTPISVEGGHCICRGVWGLLQPRGLMGFKIPQATSLTWLPSYKKWKQKQKIDDRDSEEEGTSDRRGPERRGWKRGRGQGRMYLRTQVGT